MRRPGRLLRGLAWGIIGIAVVNGLFITVEGGGLGAITAADGSVAFGAVVTLLAGMLVELGAAGGRDRTAAGLDWRFALWVEWILLLVVFVLLLFVVAARSPVAGTEVQRTRTRVRCSCPSSRRWAAPSRPCTPPA